MTLLDPTDSFNLPREMRRDRDTPHLSSGLKFTKSVKFITGENFIVEERTGLVSDWTQEISESDIYVEATRGIGRNTVIGQYLDIDQSQLPKIFRPIPVVVST